MPVELRHEGCCGGDEPPLWSCWADAGFQPLKGLEPGRARALAAKAIITVARSIVKGEEWWAFLWRL